MILNASLPVSSIMAMRYCEEFVLSSDQFQGLRPIVKMSKWLEEEIVTKAADDSIWQKLYTNAVDDGALEGKFAADITYKNGMLFRKGKVWIPEDPSLKKLIVTPLGLTPMREQAKLQLRLC